MNYIVVNEGRIVLRMHNIYDIIDYVKGKYDQAHYVPLALIEDIENDDSYEEGQYIITNGENTHLLEKKKITIHGYLYDTHRYETKIINLWITYNVLEFNTPETPETLETLETSDIQHTKDTKNNVKDIISSIDATEFINRPTILSIGNTFIAREKIEIIINTNIITGDLLEDNLVIVCNNNERIAQWMKDYPACAVFDNDEYNIKELMKVKTKLIVFDNCLTVDEMEKYMKRDNIIIMTNDTASLKYKDNVKYTLINTAQLDYGNIDNELVKKYHNVDICVVIKDGKSFIFNP